VVQVPVSDVDRAKDCDGELLGMVGNAVDPTGNDFWDWLGGGLAVVGAVAGIIAEPCGAARRSGRTGR
jgi:hypothetical protein